MSHSLVEPRHYLALIAAAFFITLAPHPRPRPAPLAAVHRTVAKPVKPAVPPRPASAAHPGAQP